MSDGMTARHIADRLEKVLEKPDHQGVAAAMDRGTANATLRHLKRLADIDEKGGK